MGNKSKEILEVAIALFAKNGFHATSMRHIAKGAKIVQSSIYNHFKSKEAILLEIVKLMKLEVVRTFDLEPDVTGKQAMEMYVDKVQTSIETNPQFWRLIHSIRMSDEIMKVMETEMGDLQNTVISKISNLLGNSRKKMDVFEIMLFWAAIDGIVAAYLMIDEYPLNQVLNKLVKKYY
ncbi:MAG: TetR/AcrR family transcriptional regulator [Leptospirales bacterium]